MKNKQQLLLITKKTTTKCHTFKLCWKKYKKIMGNYGNTNMPKLQMHKPVYIYIHIRREKIKLATSLITFYFLLNHT